MFCPLDSAHHSLQDSLVGHSGLCGVSGKWCKDTLEDCRRHARDTWRYSLPDVLGVGTAWILCGIPEPFLSRAYAEEIKVHLNLNVFSFLHWHPCPQAAHLM